MSYYTGDFYPYQGDPGFFGSLGKIFGGLGRGILGTVMPGVGTLVGGLGKLVAREGGGVSQKFKLPPGLPTTRMGLMPGGAMTIQPGAIRGLLPPAAAGEHGPCFKTSPRGRRIRVNCRTGKAVRHMRVTNPKALRRAIRRANGFAKLARKVLHFTSHKPPKGRAVFKKRRKAA